MEKQTFRNIINFKNLVSKFILIWDYSFGPNNRMVAKPIASKMMILQLKSWQIDMDIKNRS